MLDAETLELLRLAVRCAVDKKGFRISVMDVSDLTSYTDSFVICSAANTRQVGAIADEVGVRLRGAGRRPLHVEGTSGSEWMLLDYGEFIVHLFTEEKRSYYALDALWGDAPRVTADALGLDHGEVIGR